MYAHMSVSAGEARFRFPVSAVYRPHWLSNWSDEIFRRAVGFNYKHCGRPVSESQSYFGASRAIFFSSTVYDGVNDRRQNQLTTLSDNKTIGTRVC